MTTGRADVVVADMHKAFGSQPVLRGLDLRARTGSVTAVLGRSGSGKTTLLRIIAGFERPDRGSVVVGGAILDDDDHHVRPDGRRIGYVSQEGNLFPHLSVEANVGFGLPRSQRRGPQVGDLLDAVGLTGFAGRYPHQLSGGQQQRVALARALAVGSQVVLLDEPFNTLDANLRASVRADVQAIIREAEATAILVTHDQDEALLMADMVAVIRDGTIAQLATPGDIYDHPVDADLARFVGEANLIDGTGAGELVDTPFGMLTVRNAPHTAEGGRVTVLVRPEQIEVDTHSGGPGVCGRVLSADFHGSETVVSITPESDRLPSPIIARVLGNLGLVPQSIVRISVQGAVSTWPIVSGGEEPSHVANGASAAAVHDRAAARSPAPRALTLRNGPAVASPGLRSLLGRRSVKIGIAVDAVFVLVLAWLAVVALTRSGPPRQVTSNTLPPVVVDPTASTIATGGVDSQGGLGVTHGTLPPSPTSGGASTAESIPRCVDPDDCPPASALTRDPGLRQATAAEVGAIIADITPPAGQQFDNITISVADDSWGVLEVGAAAGKGADFIAVRLASGTWTSVDSGYPTLPCDESMPSNVRASLGSLVAPCSS